MQYSPKSDALPGWKPRLNKKVVVVDHQTRLKAAESRETVVDIQQNLTIGISGEMTQDIDKKNQVIARNALTSFVISESQANAAMMAVSQETASAILSASINKSRTHSEASSRLKKGRNEYEEWIPNRKKMETQNSRKTKMDVKSLEIRKTKIETGGVNLDLEDLSPDFNSSIVASPESIKVSPGGKMSMFKITHAILSQESLKSQPPKNILNMKDKLKFVT